MGSFADSLQFSRRLGRPLSESSVGQRVVLHSARLEASDRQLLAAMGLFDECELTVCRQGEPCVVEVGATRVGLSRAVARDIWVHERRENSLNAAI